MPEKKIFEIDQLSILVVGHSEYSGHVGRHFENLSLRSQSLRKEDINEKKNF